MVARAANSIWLDTPTTESTDDASPVVAGEPYNAMQSVVVDTSATGDYVDKEGRPAANDAPVTVRIPNGDASAVISAGAEITVEEFALVEIVTGEQSSSDLDIVRYTADGAIQDRDHRAIFETGAVNMTLPVSTQDRLIQIISEGPATVITANGTEQFTGPAGTSTDSILNVNETFQWATILGRGAAAGWSQYVGLVATAQSVGAMVDFSESPGPGDAGSFSLALTNSGANLRYILTLTCSNGTNFSPPLDTDDGVNRWWYDFDHTTGTVNIRRFGAFAGGSVRGVALYS